MSFTENPLRSKALRLLDDARELIDTWSKLEWRAEARADNTATELSNFLGDLEALIPEDCRNSRPDRLASVRAAVGMMAQKLAGGEAAAATAKPGTGAWAWEQMQRGPEVWVRSYQDASIACYHLKHPGLMENRFGDQFNAVDPNVLEKLWPDATDWELCAAPGSKEAAPSAKDGPTEEQLEQWRNDDKLGFTAALRLCWQAAREGMVPADSLRATTASRLLDAWQQMARDIGVEKWDGSIAGQSLCDATAAYIHSLRAELATAERRVGELEKALSVANGNYAECKNQRNSWSDEAKRIETEAGLLRADLATCRDASGSHIATAEHAIAESKELRAELERVKAELSTWDVWGGTNSLMGLSPAAARDSIASDLAELVAANDALGQIENLCGSDEELEPDEVVELVRKTLSSPQALALPLTEAQREELAKELRNALMSNAFVSWEKLGDSNKADYLKGIDAIAPRIARVGVELRELTESEIVALANEHLRVASFSFVDGDTRISLAFAGTNEFARAILAAAQGGKEPGSDALNKQYQALKHLTEDLGISGQGTFEWHFARIREAFAAQPPRGRKLTDGEQMRLSGLIGAWADRSNRNDLPEWYAIRSFVESLLAPQDEVRVALGNHALEYGRWVNSSFGTKLFDAATDRTVTQALSASTGDKFEFSVVARRVEK